MGGCASIPVSLDPVVNLAISCLCAEEAYIYNLEENLETLRKALQDLRDTRYDLLIRVETEERRGKQCLAEVETWVSRVEVVGREADELLKAGVAQTQRLCLCGFASSNCVSTYRYGKQVFRKMEEVKNLISKREDFDENVAMEAPPSNVEERPIDPPVGTKTVLENAWASLMDNSVGILGLYGMGGVGKTSLLTQINNKFGESRNKFDIVIWVLVSKGLQIDSIQEKIAERLKIREDGWHQKDQYGKATEIHKALKLKKFVLLLDDIWVEVVLTEIGVPIPTEENGSKVIFTTRSMDICGSMGAKKMEVRCLEWDAAWELFQEKVGEDTLSSDQDIPELAKSVARKCHGLPLALKIIGKTMASKTRVDDWHRAIRILSSSATKFPRMEKEILHVLKFSYDNLEVEEIKSFFVYSALFPEDYKISRRKLVDYWLYQKSIGKKMSIAILEDEGFDMINTLLPACLLEEIDDSYNNRMQSKGSVKMHDVVREMALWVAYDFKKQKEKCVVQAGVGLDQVPEIENWEDVRRISLMQNHIEDISCSPHCPKLLTLLLNRNKLVDISGGFFYSMQSLMVLDLSNNDFFDVLPKEISMLVSLQYLDLSHTSIRELSNLKGLRHLLCIILEWTRDLESVDGISHLSNLQRVRLLGSGAESSDSLVKELPCLEYLNYLTISISDAMVLRRFLRIRKLICCTEILQVNHFAYTESTSDGISFPTDMGRLLSLRICHSNIPGIQIDGESKKNKMVAPYLQNQKGPCNSPFLNLYKVAIFSCIGLSDVTWLLFAPNIVYLSLALIWGLKEVISKEKIDGATREQPEIILFRKLECCQLVGLPILESIYWEPLSFPSLVDFRVRGCPKLKKLPFNSKSGRENPPFSRIIGMGSANVMAQDVEWLRRVEWEDEEIKERLLHPYQHLFEVARKHPNELLSYETGELVPIFS